MGVVFDKQKDGWLVQYFDAQGKRHREFVGPKRLAQSVYQKRKIEIREGKFFPESLHARKVTVAEAIDEYLKKSEKRLKHFRHYKRLARYWKEEIGVKPLASVIPGDVKSYVAKRIDRFSPASINRQLAFLKKVFSDCVLDGVVQTNPVKSVRMLTENNARTRSLYLRGGTRIARSTT